MPQLEILKQIGKELTTVREVQQIGVGHLARRNPNPRLGHEVFVKAEKGEIVDRAILDLVIRAYSPDIGAARCIYALMERAFPASPLPASALTRRDRRLPYRERV